MDDIIKKTVKYTDFNGDEVQEDLYFNLTSPELTRLTAYCGGDIEAYAKKLASEGKLEEQIAFIERLILSAYGEKSVDGRRFDKSPEIVKNFEYSAAYAELFEDILMTEGEADRFGRGLVQGAKADKPVTHPAQHRKQQNYKQRK